MPVTFTLEFPGLTREQLELANERIFESLGGPPAGLIAHMESDAPGGIVVTDIWESEEAFTRFLPTLQPALEAARVDLEEPPPFREVITLFGHGLDQTDYAAIARTFYDAFTRNDPNVLDLFVDDFVEHEVVPGIPQTRDGVRQWLQMMHSAFTGLTFTPLEVTGHAGTAACRFRLTGRHTGDFLGLAPTGREISVEGIDLVRLTPDGRCREHWGAMDQGAFMAQLGMPAQAQSTEQPTEQRA